MIIRYILISLVLFFYCITSLAQTTLVLQPGFSNGSDILFGSDPAFLGPDSNSTELGAAQWTCGGPACELRSLISFDLTSIPPGANILSATLSLYANHQQLNGNTALGPMYGISNECYLYPITSSWSNATLSWNNQPTYSSANVTLLPTSTTNFQDYNNLDVSAAVQNMISNPSTNFGWLLKMSSQSFYNSMIFCSSNHPDTSKHPKLEVVYTLDNCFTFRPDPISGNDMAFGSNPAYLGPDSTSTDLGAVQWTCGGSPCELRSLLRFDISSILTGSVIQSASLSLYANPQQNNGNSGLGPMYGTTNSCDLLTVTSPWTASTLDWNNQPSVTTVNAISLPQSTSNFQDYTGLNVTTMVQLWINTPQINYGWLLQMQNTNYYNSMIFCSSNFFDSLKRPSLVICYNSVGIQEINSLQNYSLYPNPANNIINITSENENGEWLFLEVSDPSGKIIALVDKVFIQKNVFSLDISRFAKGVYFVNLKNSNGYRMLRFVKL